MTTLTFDPSLGPHVAGALGDYVAKLREHQSATPSAAEKASYERTIAEMRNLIQDLHAQS
ncbi:hypothetical protein [Arenibaculum sp.]|jgi:hypothetical protein|uniref:hypothetical protein n=1 Tax=Arenibaculum sp. TaxID=2865862 RepID=UPI002E12F290|nr:hypothetical protein [Arenibaculum sp.]